MPCSRLVPTLTMCVCIWYVCVCLMKPMDDRSQVVHYKNDRFTCLGQTCLVQSLYTVGLICFTVYYCEVAFIMLIDFFKSQIQASNIAASLCSGWLSVQWVLHASLLSINDLSVLWWLYFHLSAFDHEAVTKTRLVCTLKLRICTSTCSVCRCTISYISSSCLRYVMLIDGRRCVWISYSWSTFEWVLPSNSVWYYYSYPALFFWFCLKVNILLMYLCVWLKQALYKRMAEGLHLFDTTSILCSILLRSDSCCDSWHTRHIVLFPLLGTMQWQPS